MAAVNFYAGGKLLTGEMTERPKPVIERSDMEVGPPKQRRTQSTTMIERDVSYLFTAAEYAAFKTWFKDTALFGSVFFNWTDPVTSTVKDARIVNGEISATPLNPKLAHWRVSFVLETYY